MAQGKSINTAVIGRTIKKYSHKKIIANFTLDDGSKNKIPIASLDSLPKHNLNGLTPDISPEEMMELCLDEIYKILQKEQVGMMRDLVDRVIQEMDIIPTFTYRQCGERMSADGRFEVHLMQACSLKGTDPIKLMVDKMSSN